MIPGVVIRRALVSELELLNKCAAEDNHTAIATTHIVRKDDGIVGAVGIASVPQVFFWMDTKKTNGRDALAVVNFYENVLREHGATLISLPCPESSPFFEYIPNLGYADIGQYRLFAKDVTKG